MVTTEIAGLGTGESIWREWLEHIDLAAVRLPEPGRRVVVVAAHPDDEVLGIGGLLARLSGHPIVTVWATDGEGSHPDSTAIHPRMLAKIRREESHRALARLGLAPDLEHHLGLPDSGLTGSRRQLQQALARIIAPDDLVLCTWRADGHPDHEVVGQVIDDLGVQSWQFPIWMWHWALPADPRVPWQQARRVESIDVPAKAEAIDCFLSQVKPIGPEPADAAVLPPYVVAHFTRPFEIVFTS